MAEGLVGRSDRVRGRESPDASSRSTGPDSIGVLGSARGTNEENYLAQKFARVVLGTNNVDCCARVCHAPTAAAMKMMLGTGAATNSFDDIEQARTILVCGANPTENHPDRRRAHQAGGAARREADRHRPARDRTGAVTPTFICSCGRAPTSRCSTPSPARSSRRDLCDEAARSRARVRIWDEFREFIAALTPESVAAICGVAAQARFAQAARLYATTKPAMCFHGLGMTEHIQGTEGVMCLVNLALLTGNIGKPGSRRQSAARPEQRAGRGAHGLRAGQSHRHRSARRRARRCSRHAWRTPLPTDAGLNLMQMMDAARERKLKALWAIGYDIALTNPNAERDDARRAAQSTSSSCRTCS